MGGDDLAGAELHFGDAADAEHLVVGAVAGEVRGDRHVAELRPRDGAAFAGAPDASEKQASPSGQHSFERQRPSRLSSSPRWPGNAALPPNPCQIVSMCSAHCGLVFVASVYTVIR